MLEWTASCFSSAPTGIQAPIRVMPLLGGQTINVTWKPPQRPNGVLIEYKIVVFLVLHPERAPIETTVSDTSILNKIISGLSPFTDYEVRIRASTAGGTGEGPGTNVTTEESGTLMKWSVC